MSIEVKVPVLPESVSDATIASWHKKTGDAVKRDENLVDLETDKVVLEVPSPVDGVLKEIRQQVGDTVNSQQVIAIIEEGAVAAAQAPAAEAPKEGRIKGMLKRGLALLGTPYRWGGSTPESGFDCSGLVGYVFRNTLGIELPRISRDMANVGELVRDRDALVEGDLVFFSRKGSRVDHVGIYLGNGQFLHSPRTGKDVEVASLATGYWSQKFLQARRVATQ